MNVQKPRQKTAKPKAQPTPPRLHCRVYPSHEVLRYLGQLAVQRRQHSRDGLERLLARTAIAVLNRCGAVDCIVFFWHGQRFALSARFRQKDLRWIVEISLADRSLPLLPAAPARKIKGRRST